MSGWRVDLSQPQPHLWSTSESPSAFHLIQAIWFTHATEGWEILEEKRWMEYALRHPGYTESIFPPHILSFLFSYTTISQSCGHNAVTVTSPLPEHSLHSSFSLFTAIALFCPAVLLGTPPPLPPISARVWVSDGVLVDPVSGPVVFQCHTSEAEH